MAFSALPSSGAGSAVAGRVGRASWGEQVRLNFDDHEDRIGDLEVTLGSTWRGAWSEHTSYNAGDLVQHEGSVWRASAAIVAASPPDEPGDVSPTSWELFVAGGESAGGPSAIIELTSGTAATYTVPADVGRLKVRLVGGGGGGGGADGSAAAAGIGGGGGAGGYVEKVYETTPGATFTYTVGAFGAGGVAGNNFGTAGSDTLFDEGGSVLTAGGGGGGASMAAGTTFSATGASAAGTATGGDLNIPGTVGSHGWRFSATLYLPGSGANSVLGGGGAQGAAGDGVAGNGYGAGGGGGGTSGATDRAGGNGAPGVIIIEEYS